MKKTLLLISSSLALLSYPAISKISTEQRILDCHDFSSTAQQIMEDYQNGMDSKKLSKLYVKANPDYIDGLRNENFIKQALKAGISENDADKKSKIKQFRKLIYDDCYREATGKRSKIAN